MTADHRLTAISLFSGCGGMDLGVHQAGFRILATVELDIHAFASLQRWVSQLTHPPLALRQDVRTIDPAALSQQLGLKPGNLDMLFGGPPCQPFSLIGKRKGLEDERGLLLFEMTRFAKAWRPRVVFVEQVKGLKSASHDGRLILDIFAEEMASLGYKTKWAVLNAARYGVPQLRERMFIVSTLGDNDFSFPEPTHYLQGEEPSLFEQPCLTVGEAISDLPPPFRKGDTALTDPCHVDVTPEGDRRRIRNVPEGGYLANQHHLPAEIRRNLHPKKDTTKFRRMSRSSPALTLRGGEIFYHPTEDRYLTPREYLCLHGFPRDFILEGPVRGRSGTYKNLDQHRQVANSVPPPLAQAVARSIALWIMRRKDAEQQVGKMAYL